MQIETHNRILILRHQTGYNQKVNNKERWWGRGGPEPSDMAGENGNSAAAIQQGTELSDDLAILLLGLYPREMKTYAYTAAKHTSVHKRSQQHYSK